MSTFDDIRGIDFVAAESSLSSSSSPSSASSSLPSSSPSVNSSSPSHPSSSKCSSSSSSTFSSPSTPSSLTSTSATTSSSPPSSSSSSSLISLKRKHPSISKSSSSSIMTQDQYPVPATKEYELSIQILHQLCAFEQIFHEFFAVLDNLKKPAIRASSKLYYDRKYLFVNPVTKRLARRDDDENTLLLMIHRITRSQRDLEDNLIPEYWLEKVESNFILALSNTQVHLRSIPEWNDQVGLFAKPLISSPPSPPADLPANADEIPNKRKRRRPNGRSASSGSTSKSPTSVSGIEFVLFSFPDTDEDPVDLGFNNQLIFDEIQHGEEYICLGLGMARVINHNCSESVIWKFPEDKMEFNNSIEDVGCLAGKLHRKKKKIMPGDQIFAFYSNNFAKYECQCSNGRLHKGPRYQSSTPVPAFSPSATSSIGSVPESVRTPSTTLDPSSILSDIASIPNSFPEEAQSITTIKTTSSPINSPTEHDHTHSENDTEEEKIHDVIMSFPLSPSSSSSSFKRPRISHPHDADTTRDFQLGLPALPKTRIAGPMTYQENRLFKGTSHRDPIIIDSDDDHDVTLNIDVVSENGRKFIEPHKHGKVDLISESGIIKTRVEIVSVSDVEEEITFVKMIKRGRSKSSSGCCMERKI